MDNKEFQIRKKDLFLKMYEEKNYRICPTTHEDICFFKELIMHQSESLFARAEHDDFNNISMVIFDQAKVERELIKMGELRLCPFRKKQVATEHYRESSDYEDVFLPCYKEKCMLYLNTFEHLGICRLGNKT